MCCEDALFTPVAIKLAMLCFLLNLVAPGFGTLLHAYYGGSVNDNLKFRRCIIALAQFALTFVIFGWLWSVIYGVRIFWVSLVPPTISKAMQDIGRV